MVQPIYRDNFDISAHLQRQKAVDTCMQVTGVTNRDASRLVCHVAALLSTTTTWPPKYNPTPTHVTRVRTPRIFRFCYHLTHVRLVRKNRIIFHRFQYSRGRYRRFDGFYARQHRPQVIARNAAYICYGNPSVSLCLSVRPCVRVTRVDCIKTAEHQNSSTFFYCLIGPSFQFFVVEVRIGLLGKK